MVPDGWDISSLDNLHIKVVDGDRGVNYPKNTDYLDAGYSFFVGAGNVLNGRLDTTEALFISKEKHSQLRKGVIEYGDLLLVMRGNGTGRVAIYDDSVPYKIARINSGLAILRVSKNVSREYFFHLLSSSVITNQFKSYMFGSAQPQLTIKILKSLKLPIPNITEQKKIARILSTWDKAIATVENLIANSQQQKMALMQQLLTGKKRLPGFDGRWQDKYLTDIAEVIVSPVDKKSVDGEVPVELCNYTDVYYNSYITRSIEFMEATATASEINKYTLQTGDVIITKDSETPGDIAVPAVVEEELGGVLCGYHLAIIRPKNEVADGGYLNFLFSMPKTRYYFFTLATGATRFGLSVAGINKAHFTLPPYDEQQAISRVLKGTDKEVALLKSLLEKFKSEKKALMQQLLTGKRRVS